MTEELLKKEKKVYFDKGHTRVTEVMAIEKNYLRFIRMKI